MFKSYYFFYSLQKRQSEQQQQQSLQRQQRQQTEVVNWGSAACDYLRMNYFDNIQNQIKK
jgi:hypothetical protein